MKKKNFKNKKIILGVIVGGLIIVAILFLVFGNLSKDDELTKFRRAEQICIKYRKTNTA